MLTTLVLLGAFSGALMQAHPLDSIEVENYEKSRFDAQTRDDLASRAQSDELKWALEIQRRIAEEQEADKVVHSINVFISLDLYISHYTRPFAFLYHRPLSSSRLFPLPSLS